jgi:hypothetical protein
MITDQDIAILIPDFFTNGNSTSTDFTEATIEYAGS